MGKTKHDPTSFSNSTQKIEGLERSRYPNEIFIFSIQQIKRRADSQVWTASFNSQTLLGRERSLFSSAVVNVTGDYDPIWWHVSVKSQRRDGRKTGLSTTQWHWSFPLTLVPGKWELQEGKLFCKGPIQPWKRRLLPTTFMKQL